MRKTKVSAAWTAAAMMAGVLLMASPDAWALEKCKARLKKQDGTITVDAQAVTGTLRWGWDPGMIVFDFDNEASCLAGSVAKGCTLAPAGNPLRITPPPMCTLYLDDDVDACISFISGCAPAARPICPPDTEQVGSWCIDRVGMYPPVEFGEAVAVCQSKGRSLCPLDALLECDQNRNGANYPYGSCAAYTDGQTSGWIWTITPAALDNQNFFSFMTVYQDNNVANVQSTSIGSLYSAFCCQRLAGGQ